MERCLLIAISAYLLIGNVFTGDAVPKSTSENVLQSCCSKGMYASAMYQECTFDPAASSGLGFDDSVSCSRMFSECCRAYRDTKSCASGVGYALNGSYCPFMTWSVAGAKERVQRSCCEACLEGLRDREIGDPALGDRACKRTVRDFNGDMELTSYSDCCKRRLAIAASANSLAGGREIEGWAESEVVVHRSKALSISSGSSSDPLARLETGHAAGHHPEDKPCSQNNPCGHFCVDEFAFAPKHCTCRKDFFLAEDGATCIRAALREPHARERCSERSRATFRSEDATSDETHCNPGYGFSRRERRCMDIDECADVSQRRCYSDQRCVNLEGSFFCADNVQVTPAPSELSRPSSSSSGSSSSSLSQACDRGLSYSNERGYCVDENECELRLHNCSSHEVCRNTYKSFTCDCGRGYNKDSSGHCVDIDECMDRRYSLCPSSESICYNTPGSYRCLCKEGFVNGLSSDGTVDMTTCVDTDECVQTPNICGHHGTCYNSHGSYRCRCMPGYITDPATGACNDIDECASVSGRLCIGKCTNTPGSFRCDCPLGFKLDASGRVCEDIDECKASSGDACHSGETCLNTIGGVKCYSVNCPQGYYKDTARVNRCNKRTIKQVYDQQTRKVTFDSDQQPHYITYNYLTFAGNVTSGRPFYEFSFDSSSERYEFELEVADVKTRPQRPGAPPAIPATKAHFEVSRQGRNGAALYVVKPLTGPQDVELHFKVLDTDGNMFYKAAITVYISEYDGVNF